MLTIKVEFDAKALKGLRADVRKAAGFGLVAGAREARKHVIANSVTFSNATQAAATARVKAVTGSRAGLIAIIPVVGKPTRMEKDVQGGVTGRGPLSASPWGKNHTFVRSFITSVKGLKLARLGGTRFPIRSLKGPNLAKDALDPAGAVLPGLERDVETIVADKVLDAMLKVF